MTRLGNNDRISIDSEALDYYCLGAMRLKDLFRRPEHWPGPFPPRTMGVSEESDVRENRGKMLSAICSQFPQDYADRLLFTHAVHLIISRSLFPWINLFSDDLLYFEGVLHAEPEEGFYRDHYVHSLEVGCIGEKLLDEVYIGGRALGEILLDSFRKMAAGRKKEKEPEKDSPPLEGYFLDCGIRPEDFDEKWLKGAWWLAALYHDIGYFAQKSGRLFDERLSRSFPLGWNRVLTSWNRHELGDELVWRQAEVWRMGVKHFKSFQTEELLALMAEKDHPALGALTVSALSRRVLQYMPLSQPAFCAMQVASHAILCHDHTGLAKYLRRNWDGKEAQEAPLFRLDYWDNPLAALLVICDHISEFHRERLRPVSTQDAKRVSSEVATLWKGVEIEIDGRCLNIRFISHDGGKGDDSNHFKEDKQWFLPCNTPGKQAPYLKLDKRVFDVLVHLDT